MTDEMLELARRNAADAGVENVEFVKGHIEELPLPDASVDVVISNCVINLSADKPRVIREAARVLRRGGRFAVSDVIADPDMDAATRADMQAWTGRIAGALTRAEFERALRDAGLADVEIRETHRVHEHASLGDRARSQAARRKGRLMQPQHVEVVPRAERTVADVVIVGGGQSGLAAAYARGGRGCARSCSRPARSRSGRGRTTTTALALFSPARFSALPGRPFPGDGERYPTRDEVVAYLRAYAADLDADIRCVQRVDTVDRAEDGRLLARTATGLQVEAGIVIAATGGFRRRIARTLRAWSTSPAPSCTPRSTGRRTRSPAGGWW